MYIEPQSLIVVACISWETSLKVNVYNACTYYTVYIQNVCVRITVYYVTGGF